MIRKDSTAKAGGHVWTLTLALVLSAGLRFPGFPSEACGLEVSPGTLVRWPGEAVERCGLGEETWQPLGAACWYAIDLLAAERELKVLRWRQGAREQRSLRVGPYPYEVQYITLEDDSQVQLSSENLRRVQEENRKIGALWGLRTDRRFELPLGPPLAELPQGGRFGARRFFNNQPRSPHTGSDYKGAVGTPILAIGAGTVALTGDFFFPGKSVFIDHGDGLISMYFHLSGIAVEESEDVERGEVIGLVGQSGRATGPHLHLGVRWRGARIDPGLLFEAPSSVPAIP